MGAKRKLTKITPSPGRKPVSPSKSREQGKDIKRGSTSETKPKPPKK